MKQKAAQLFSLMQQELEDCSHGQEKTAACLECCFQVCNQYWEMLRRELEGYTFPDETEEVEFFKTIKPRFTSEKEYYSLRYHAQLFMDSIPDPVTLQAFWSREVMRLDKFVAEHASFYSYYKGGHTMNDRGWFVRQQNCDAQSSHDHLASMLVALERYTEFGKEALNSIKQHT